MGLTINPRRIASAQMKPSDPALLFLTEKAFNALEEIGRDGDRSNRLELAWDHLEDAFTDEILKDRAEVKGAFQNTRRAFETGTVDERSEAIRSAIFQVIWECGYSHAVRQLDEE